MSVHNNLFVKNNVSVDGSVLADNIDAITATTLLLGSSTATKIELADTGVTTEVQGNLDVLEGLDITGNTTTTGYIQFTDIEAPTTPSDGTGRLYKKTGENGIWWKPDAAGSEIDLTSTGTGGLLITVSSLGGTSIFGSILGANLQFKGLTATSTRIGLTANINDVGIDVNEGNIDHQNLSGAGTNTHVQIDTHIADTNNPHSVTAAQVGLGDVSNVLCKDNATTAPTANDDSANTSGNGTFSVGSCWTDITNDKSYILVDATATAAVWRLTTTVDTNDVTEATNLYYTEARVSANTDVAANTTHSGLTSGNPHNVTTGDLGIPFCKYDATAAPTVNDDSANTSGNGTFAVGSCWFDVTNDKVYHCVDAIATSAVWTSATDSSAHFVLHADKITVNETSLTSCAYFAWDQSTYGSFHSGTCIFWAENLSTGGFTAEIYDGTSVIGTITVSSGAANGIKTFTFTNPTVNKMLDFRVKKDSSSGEDPYIYGIQLKF